MALSRAEREELADAFAELKFNRGVTQEDSLMADKAVWAALCHASGRCGLSVDQAYPNTPQARVYKLLHKALING